jgi:hypothetical protein
VLCDVTTWVDTSDQAIKGSLVMVTVITAYLSFIIKAVAAEHVAECGGLLPKNSVFPVYFEMTMRMRCTAQSLA